MRSPTLRPPVESLTRDPRLQIREIVGKRRGSEEPPISKRDSASRHARRERILCLWRGMDCRGGYHP